MVQGKKRAFQQGSDAMIPDFCFSMKPRSKKAPWAATKKKRTGGLVEPSGPLCQNCGSTAARGFHGKSIPELLDLTRTNKTFKESFLAADAVRRGSVAGTFRRQTVAGAVLGGFQVSKRYVLLSELEFEQKFGLTAKQASLPVELVVDEEGSPFQGVILEEGHECVGWGQSYRYITVYHTVQDSLNESFLAADMQIRENQGKDTYDYVVGQRMAKRSNRMKRATKTATPSDIQVAKEKRLQAATLSSGAACEAEKGDVSEEEEEVKATEVVPNLELSPDKSKRKSLAAAKAKPDKKRKVTEHAPLESSVKAPSSDGASVRGSVLGAPSTVAASGQEKKEIKLGQNVDRYVSDLDIYAALSGKKLGHKVRLSQRTLQSLRAQPDHSGKDLNIVTLEQHLELFALAEKLATEVSTMPPEERKKALQSLKAECADYPPAFKSELVSLAARESPGMYGTDSTALANLWEVVCPFGSQKAFDPVNPRLKDANLDADEQLKLLNHLLFEKCLVNGVQKQETGQPELMAQCSCFAEMIAAGL